ncbi:hypothetical protein IWW38_004636, partial [Coemansia aciculifera]
QAVNKAQNVLTGSHTTKTTPPTTTTTGNVDSHVHRHQDNKLGMGATYEASKHAAENKAVAAGGNNIATGVHSNDVSDRTRRNEGVVGKTAGVAGNVVGKVEGTTERIVGKNHHQHGHSNDVAGCGGVTDNKQHQHGAHCAPGSAGHKQESRLGQQIDAPWQQTNPVPPTQQQGPLGNNAYDNTVRPAQVTGIDNTRPAGTRNTQLGGNSLVPPPNEVSATNRSDEGRRF